MDAFCTHLNDLLVKAFRAVLKLEEQMLARMSTPSLSIGEFHLIETVGKDDGRSKTISEIARDLSLSLPSVTVAVNKLEKKGFLKKTKGAEDGRTVSISLTELGARLDRVHQHFHERMVQTIAEDMSEEEKAALLKGIAKLNRYFDKTIAVSQ